MSLGVQENRPVVLSKLAPVGRPATDKSTNNPCGSSAVMSNRTGAATLAPTCRGDLTLGGSRGSTLSLSDADLPDRAAVRVTYSLEAGRSAATSNFASTAPASTVTPDGALTTGRLVDRFTAVGLVVALVSFTVQAVLCPLPRVVFAQLTPDNCADDCVDAIRLKLKVRVTPPALAVITAV